jgi:hypothetical protein
MRNEYKIDHFARMAEEPIQKLSEIPEGTYEYEIKSEYQRSWKEISQTDHNSIRSWSDETIIEIDRWDSDNSVRRRTRLVLSTSFCLLASFGLIPFQIPFLEIQIDEKYEFHILIILFIVQIFCYWSYNISIRQRNIRIALNRSVHRQYERFRIKNNRVYMFVESNLRELRFFYKQIPSLMFRISMLALILRLLYVSFFYRFL